jgi:uncharacterized protein
MVGPQTFSKATLRAARAVGFRTRPKGENLGATALKIAVVVMWVGALEFDLLLGEVHSLKEKRSVVRPLIAEVRKRFELSVAEVDHLNLHRRAGVGVAAVSPDHAHLVEVLDSVERLVAYRPEVELLSVRRIVRTGED